MIKIVSLPIITALLATLATSQQNNQPQQQGPCVPAVIKLPRSVICILNGPKSPIAPPPPCPTGTPKPNPVPPSSSPVTPVTSVNAPKWLGASDVVIDAVAANTVGSTAFVGHRLEANGETTFAVFTGGNRIVVDSDEKLPAGIIIRVLKDGLRVLPTGEVTWQGEFITDIHEALQGISHRGLFVERRLVQILPDSPAAGVAIMPPVK